MRPKNYLINGQLWAFGHPCCWETFAKSVIWCSPGKIRAHFAGSEVLKSPPLMFNSFQSMDLIVLDASSLLADDHRNLLQVFIFWNSPPVPMRMASLPFHPSCLTALALFLSLKTDKEIMLFSFGICATECFSYQSSVSATKGMLTASLLRKCESGLFGARPKIILWSVVLEWSDLVKEKMAVVRL